MLSVTLFFTILICIYHVSCVCPGVKPELCDFTDTECVSKASNTLYTKVVKGIPGVMEPIDPLNQGEIYVDTSNIKYSANDVTLYGLINCSVKELSMKISEGIYTYHVLCPKLRIESKSYKLNGILNENPVKGSGLSNINCRNSSLHFTGHYSKFISEAKELHFHIEDFTLKFTADDIDSEFEGLSVIFKDKPNDWKTASKEYSQKLEEIIHQPLIDKFVPKFFDNHEKILKTFPIMKIIVRNLNLDCL